MNHNNLLYLFHHILPISVLLDFLQHISYNSYHLLLECLLAHSLHWRILDPSACNDNYYYSILQGHYMNVSQNLGLPPKNTNHEILSVAIFYNRPCWLIESNDQLLVGVVVMVAAVATGSYIYANQLLIRINRLYQQNCNNYYIYCIDYHMCS